MEGELHVVLNLAEDAVLIGILGRGREGGGGGAGVEEGCFARV